MARERAVIVRDLTGYEHETLKRWESTRHQANTMNEEAEIEAAIAKLKAELESAKTIWQHWEPYACFFIGVVVGIVLAHFVSHP